MIGPVLKVLDVKEPWAEYQLEDGTLLRFRFSACSFRLTGKQTEQGEPEYSFQSHIQCETFVVPKAAEVRQLRAVQDTAPSGYVAPDEDVG